jgi:hypothetical protein
MRLNLYDSISECDIEIDYFDCSHREYTWLIPISEPVQYVHQDMQAAYTNAVIGISHQSTFRTQRKIKYKIRSRYLGINKTLNCDSWTLSVWLLSNKYTQATRDTYLASAEVSIGVGRSSMFYYREVEDLLRRCKLRF